jgi:hypothetical protein
VALPGRPTSLEAVDQEGHVVEIKIGVQNAPRELALDSNQSRDEVEKAVEKALSGQGVLRLTDDRGRLFVIPGDRVAYVEIGEPVERRVGFGTM